MPSFDVVLKNPGQFIAAVPAMLGFVPQRSLVVVVLLPAQPGEQNEAHVALRLDLPAPADQYSRLRQRITQMCRRSNAVAALVVIVDDRIASPVGGRGDGAAERQVVVDALRRDLADDDIALPGAWAVSHIRGSAEWQDIDAPESRGLLPDPSASQLAAERVYRGRVLHASRDEVTRSLAVDPVMRRQVSAALPEAVVDGQRRLARAIQINNPDAYTRMALWQVISVITHARDGVPLAARTIAEVAVALRDSTVRDIMFGVAGGAHAQAAEYLWGVLARALPDPDRAEAATLLAFHAYLRGDGVLAGIALDQALASDPDHRMAVLLDTALQTAMPPARLNRLVNSGIEAAGDLRIDIGATAVDSDREAAR